MVVATHHTQTPDAMKQAKGFLYLLDPTTKDFHFRTFPEGGSEVPARKLSGSLTQISAELRALNANGSGVFVVVNEGGQTKASITRVRAVFADTDGAPLEPLLAALKPHIVVQSSPEKWHVYWLVDSDFPLDMFGPVQSAIASKFGTDHAVKDLPRVMRLPGFNHCKADPVPVSLVQFAADLPRYNLDQTIAGLGLQLNAAPSNDAFANMGDDLGGGMTDSYPFTTENAERFLSAAKAAYPNPRGYEEYIAVVSMCAELVAGQSWPEDEARRICDAVCNQASGADQSNNAALWTSTLASTRTKVASGQPVLGHRSVFRQARDNGWTDDVVAGPSASSNLLDAFNQKYAVARYLDNVVILETERPGIIGYMKEGEFSLLHRNKTITVSNGQGGTKQSSAVTAWLASSNRRTYEGGAHFAPGQNLPPDQFNTWRGWPVTPVAGDWSNFREFMREVICAGDAAVFDYLAKLLACWVQRPHHPGHVAIFMRGEKGVGKSFFARKIGSLFEPHALYIGDRNLLTGTFTGHFREANFAFFDEAVWNGSHEDANRLKALITERDMMLHPKGLTPYRVNNSLHIIVATNDEFAASASHDERRVCMLKPSSARRIDRKYFAQIESEWESGEKAALLAYLLTMDIKGFNPEQIPQTDELTNQKLLSLPESERLVFELLRDGAMWSDPDKHGNVQKSSLAYSLAERTSGIEKRQADTRMGNTIKRIFGTQVLVKREASGSRQRIWILPPLAESRAIFEQYLKVTALDWE